MDELPFSQLLKLNRNQQPQPDRALLSNFLEDQEDSGPGILPDWQLARLQGFGLRDLLKLDQVKYKRNSMVRSLEASEHNKGRIAQVGASTRVGRGGEGVQSRWRGGKRWPAPLFAPP